MTDVEFPDGFLWGASTSAFQIEGAVDEDGRGTSIWDVFASNPENIEDGDDGTVTADHYHRFRDDVRIMAELGLDAYRFSIAWPRILPEGTGRVNQAGIDFYSRLVDELLEAGIRPVATLYHWDLPQTLEDRGGWPERGVVDAFVEYADVITDSLGDRIPMWMTVNEPSVAAWLGYLEGVHAPGKTSWPDALAAAHHMLLAHARTVELVHSKLPESKIGPALQMVPAEPASSSAADRRATTFFDGMWNRWFHDPIAGLGYPEEFIDLLVERQFIESKELPFVEPGDLESIATPNDFLGINFYSRAVLRSDETPEEDNAPREVFVSDNKTEMDWEVRPQELTRALRMLGDRYPGHPELFVAENGAAYRTGPDSDGVIRDHKRIAYLDGHIRAAARAIELGVPLRGYFVWSLLDNFEWGFGKTKRFGLIWVDYETLERTPKQSAHWYRDVISRNGILSRNQETA